MREIQPAGSPLSLVENVLDSAPQRLLLRQRPLAVAQAVVAKGPRVLVGSHDDDDDDDGRLIHLSFPLTCVTLGGREAPPAAPPAARLLAVVN